MLRRTISRRHGYNVKSPSPSASASPPTLSLRYHTLYTYTNSVRSLRIASHTPSHPPDRNSLASSGSASSVLAVRHAIKSRGLLLGPSAPPTFTRRKIYTSPLPYYPHQRSFSSSQFAMTATKIDGTAIAKKIREKLHAEIEATQKANPRFKPSLKIIQGRTSANLSCTHANFNHSWGPIRLEYVKM